MDKTKYSTSFWLRNWLINLTGTCMRLYLIIEQNGSSECSPDDFCVFGSSHTTSRSLIFEVMNICSSMTVVQHCLSYLYFDVWGKAIPLVARYTCLHNHIIPRNGYLDLYWSRFGNWHFQREREGIWFELECKGFLGHSPPDFLLKRKQLYERFLNSQISARAPFTICLSILISKCLTKFLSPLGYTLFAL